MGSNPGHDVGPGLIWPVVLMLLTVGMALALLRLDLQTAAAVERGDPPASFVVVFTPATYGPPPR